MSNNSLQASLSKAIRQNGGYITLDKFMSMVMPYYYQHARVFGKKGDFITAPEISQLFGEMIGIWCVNTWMKYLDSVYHSPIRRTAKKKVSIVEIGAGRGTMMRDLLRGVNHASDFCRAIDRVWIVETSEKLSAVQRETLSDYRDKYNITWVSKIEEVVTEELTDSFVLLVNNELFDALPIKQYRYDPVKKIYNEVVVCINEDMDGKVCADRPFKFHVSDYEVCKSKIDDRLYSNEIVEDSVEGDEMMVKIMKMLQGLEAACLLIDYGYIMSPTTGTLQAVKGHKYHDVMKDIGDSDITSLVDFRRLHEVISLYGIESSVKTQRAFLIEHGIIERAKNLGNNAKSDTVRQEIYSGLRRLIHPDEMGRLFKVLEFYTKMPL